MTDVYQFCVTGSHLKVTEVEDVAMGSNKVGGWGGSVIQYIISDVIVKYEQNIHCTCISWSSVWKLSAISLMLHVRQVSDWCGNKNSLMYKIVWKIYVIPGLTNNMKRYFCLIWASDIHSWTGVFTWRTYNGTGTVNN